MKYGFYLIRDTVALSYVRAFDAPNDNAAVRYVVDLYGKQPHFSDLELYRTGFSYDLQSGDVDRTSDKVCVALPPQPVAPSVDAQLNKE